MIEKYEHLETQIIKMKKTKCMKVMPQNMSQLDGYSSIYECLSPSGRIYASKQFL